MYDEQAQLFTRAPQGTLLAKTIQMECSKSLKPSTHNKHLAQ